jgi:hypothetical protein
MGNTMQAFLPSLAFFVIAPLSVSLALWLAFAAAFAISLSAFGATRSIRLFDGANFLLFGVLALYTAFVDAEFGPSHTALVLDCGLLAAILWSMAKRKPFTTQYRWLHWPEAPEVAARAHILLTSIWASAYAAMAGASAGAAVLHKMSPVWSGVAGLLIFAATLTFTWQFGPYIDRHGVPPSARR